MSVPVAANIGPLPDALLLILKRFTAEATLTRVKMSVPSTEMALASIESMLSSVHTVLPSESFSISFVLPCTTTMALPLLSNTTGLERGLVPAIASATEGYV